MFLCLCFVVFFVLFLFLFFFWGGGGGVVVFWGEGGWGCGPLTAPDMYLMFC